ncbi:hypothetical protein Glove_372g18 [Diversispora epigaea]|uniref:Uncharacterized protein n=1 Tax=Diversispora epigaea TaxID=1348612 RepID=A0A397HAA9_9GLOM|nr:hypothetical protein Glove_372g18 [Diversispora epigaea]
MFRDMIPSMINVLQQCLNDGDNDSVIKGFELVDSLSLVQCLNDGDNDSVIKGFELVDSLSLVGTPLFSHYFPHLI